MTIFNKIKIKRFRGIDELELNKFKQFNLIVGKNDTGKTSVLEALYISINPGNPNLPITTNVHRGIDTIENNNQFWISLFKDYNIDNLIELDLLLFTKQKLKINIKPKVVPSSIINEKLRLDISNGTTTTEQIIQGLRTSFNYESNNGTQPINQHTEIIFNPSNPQKPLDTKLPSGWKPILNGYYLSIQNTYGPDLASRVGELITLKQEKELVEVLQEFDKRIKDINLS